METLDFAVRPADGVDATMCIKCGSVKPNAQFKRTLTPMQAASRGYTNDRPVWYHSMVCLSCKPIKHKSLQGMTTKEIKNLKAIGKIRQLDMDDALRLKKEKMSRNASRATKRRWVNARRPVWQPMIQEISAEIIALRQQGKHFQKVMPDTDDHEFFATYMTILLGLRQELKHRMATGKALDYLRWQDYLSFDQVDDLMLRWQGLVSSLPIAYTNRLRVPAFKVLMDTRERQAAPKVTLMNDDSADRLAQIG